MKGETLLPAPELSSLTVEQLRLELGVLEAAFRRDSMFMKDTRLGLALCGVLGACPPPLSVSTVSSLSVSSGKGGGGV